MKPILTAALCSIVALAACDSANPFMEEVIDEEPVEEDPVDEEPVDEDVEGGEFDVTGTPPGVAGPEGAVDQSIVRFEERNANGGGFAEDFQYDAESDTFTVDNLAFDGEGAYTRGTAVASLGPNDSYAVYNAEVLASDFIDESPIGQIAPYRAIVGVSPNTVDGVPRTSFAIVRTGGFANFGFGGFVYQREGGVTLPDARQATYTGDYAGVRVFSGPDGVLGGTEFTEASMEISIDFDDPTSGQGGVRGRIFDRVAFDINGEGVELGNDVENGELPLPTIGFVLEGETGNINDNGELTGGLASNYVTLEGEVVPYEAGTYFGILAGDATDETDGGEIVGVLVIESGDPRTEGVTAQETGGFILLR